jgi:hypothetical protein
MQNPKVSVGIAIVLILAGIVFLLGNFGVLGPLGALVWGVLFAAAGLVFLWVFASNPERWWAIIPGFTLLGLAAQVAFSEVLGPLGGTLFLGAIGLSFWVIYLFRRELWWAVIPGGVLITLAIVAGIGEVVPGEATGGIFFLGMAATFLLVYLLPNPEKRMTWALIPAGVLGLMGVLLLAFTQSMVRIIGPLALIVAGGVLVARALTARRKA